MSFCDKCANEDATTDEYVDDRGGESPVKLQKYTYVLPSGRKLKVVVDNDNGPMEATS